MLLGKEPLVVKMYPKQCIIPTMYLMSERYQ
jgi:hypothetical protein